MSRIALLDTSLDSNNDGDAIIVQSIVNEFPALAGVPRVPTHRALTEEELDIARTAEILVFTGTNVLSSALGAYRQWQLTDDARSAFEGKVVFLGVGWWQYEDEFSAEGAEVLRGLMHPELPIAARDRYSVEMLASQGIDAVNTNCPTMWSLPPTLSTPKVHDECVVTITDYRPARVHDRMMLSVLHRRYSRIHIWPQGARLVPSERQGSGPGCAHQEACRAGGGRAV